MTRRVLDWMHAYRLFPWAVTAMLLPSLLWPASWWLDVREVSIRSASYGKPLPMVVDREVKRGFLAEWQVTIRQWDGAGWLTWCNAEGKSNYRPDARYPKDLALQWWTDGACHPVPPGRYRVTTTWVIPVGALLPDKVVSVDSNVFEVTP